MDRQTCIELLEKRLTELKTASANKTRGIPHEKNYGDAYRLMVRNGHATPLRKKYRGN